MTSTLKRIDVATYDIIKDALQNKFTSGTHTFDLADQGVGLAKFNPVVPKDVQNQVKQYENQIESGKLQVSPNM